MASPPAGYRKLILNARRFGPALDGLRSVETVSGLLERTSGPLRLLIGDIQHSARSLLNVTSSQSRSEVTETRRGITLNLGLISRVCEISRLTSECS
ncbi:hypothetical protein CHARACLAT_026067 [Characodon lateralis]|uniref:Uncharacterized protein n=1 Tax=Characodon lateralis TaxID=208331 RepID=A0ABU7DA71_9TELE|nr:hypothetical protein [Characodon lateralis]